MTDPVWAVGVTGASMAVMYVLYVRPMRRGRGDHSVRTATDPARRDELLRLRHELATLRDGVGTQ